jgi:hypothetical protein
MKMRSSAFRAFGTAVVLAALSLFPLNLTAAPEFKIERDRPSELMPGPRAVLKMSQSRLPDDIITGYITGSPLSFYMAADDIIFLQQQGISADLLRAMIHRNAEEQQTRASVLAAAAPAPVPSPAPAPPYYATAPAAPYSYASQAAYPVYAPYNYDSFYYYPFLGRGGYHYNGVSRVASVAHFGGVHGGSVGHLGGVGPAGRRR